MDVTVHSLVVGLRLGVVGGSDGVVAGPLHTAQREREWEVEKGISENLLSSTDGSSVQAPVCTHNI